MTGVIGNNNVSCGGFSVHIKRDLLFIFRAGDIQEVDAIIYFFLGSKCHCSCYIIK